jgi:hypothetical protein
MPEKKILIKSKHTWYASLRSVNPAGDTSWMALSKSSGAANYPFGEYVNVGCTDNIGTIVRTGYIDVISGGERIEVNVTQLTEFYVLTIGAIPTQPASGGNVTVPVTSTLNGTTVGWTFNSAGSTSGITIVSGEGTAAPVFNIPANTGAQRNLTIAIKQSVGTKTATREFIQKGYLDVAQLVNNGSRLTNIGFELIATP